MTRHTIHSFDPFTRTRGYGLECDDEFSVGTTIDTAGTRFGLATPWTAQNLSTTVVSQADSCLILNPPGGGTVLRGYSQPVSGTWKRRSRLSMTCVDGEVGACLAVRRTANGKMESFGQRETGDLRLHSWTDASTHDSTPNQDNFKPGAWLHVEIEADGSNLIYRVSLSGADGSFMDYTTRAYTDYLGGAPDEIWVAAMMDSGTTRAFAAFDWFRGA